MFDIAALAVAFVTWAEGQFPNYIVGVLASVTATHLYNRRIASSNALALSPQQLHLLQDSALEHLARVARRLIAELAELPGPSPYAIQDVREWLTDAPNDPSWQPQRVLDILESEVEQPQSALRTEVWRAFDLWYAFKHPRVELQSDYLDNVRETAVQAVLMACAAYEDELEQAASGGDDWAQHALAGFKLDRVRGLTLKIFTEIQALKELDRKLDVLLSLVKENEEAKRQIAAQTQHIADLEACISSERNEMEAVRLRAEVAEAEAKKVQVELSDFHFNAGYEAFEKEDYRTALAEYEASKQVLVTHAIMQNLGLVYDTLGEYDKALTAYDEAERLRKAQALPDSPGLAMNRGNVYRNLGRHEEALTAYREAEQARKELGLLEDPGLALNRGNAYNGLGRFDDALKAYSEAERLLREQDLPEDPVLAMNSGNVFQQLGRFEEAIKAYGKAVQLRKARGRPDDPRLKWNLALMYWRKDDMKRACKLARQSLQVFVDRGWPVPSQVVKFIVKECGK